MKNIYSTFMTTKFHEKIAFNDKYVMRAVFNDNHSHKKGMQSS